MPVDKPSMVRHIDCSHLHIEGPHCDMSSPRSQVPTSSITGRTQLDSIVTTHRTESP